MLRHAAGLKPVRKLVVLAFNCTSAFFCLSGVIEPGLSFEFQIEQLSCLYLGQGDAGSQLVFDDDRF